MPFDEALATRVRAQLAKAPVEREYRMMGGLAFNANGRMPCGREVEQIEQYWL
jgi:hypothetical protein